MTWSPTPEQRENLAKLAAYLERPDEERRKRFGMAGYCATVDEEGHEDKCVTLSHHPCGAVACAVGNGPDAGVEAKRGEAWWSYSRRAFCAGEVEWRWCFTGLWSHCDNTPTGAAWRIRYLLQHGEAPAEDSPLWLADPAAGYGAPL